MNALSFRCPDAIEHLIYPLLYRHPNRLLDWRSLLLRFHYDQHSLPDQQYKICLFRAPYYLTNRLQLNLLVYYGKKRSRTASHCISIPSKSLLVKINVVNKAPRKFFSYLGSQLSHVDGKSYWLINRKAWVLECKIESYFKRGLTLKIASWKFF